MKERAMEEVITVVQLEAAINVGRAHSPSDVGTATLCKPAADLAECYAAMIVGRQKTLSTTQMTASQRAAFEQAQQGKEAVAP
jgi:hypothetical protein